MVLVKEDVTGFPHNFQNQISWHFSWPL